MEVTGNALLWNFENSGKDDDGKGFAGDILNFGSVISEVRNLIRSVYLLMLIQETLHEGHDLTTPSTLESERTREPPSTTNSVVNDGTRENS